MIRVSNIAQFEIMTSNIFKTQSDVAATQVQMASGKKSQSYAPLATDANQLVSMERSISRSEQFKTNIDSALGRLNLMESALGTMVDRSTDVLATIAQGLSGANMDDLPLEQFAETYLSEIEAELNKQNGGFYIFGGTKTDIPPVDLADADYDPQAGLPGSFSADDSYYQGDEHLFSVRADDSLETIYGVTADDPTFEKLLRGLSYMSYAGANSDKDVLQQAYDLINDAVDGLSDLRGEVGANTKVLEQQKVSHQGFQLFAENLVSNIEDVDIAAASTQLAFDELQLQGAYSALSRMRSMSLLQYLN